MAESRVNNLAKTGQNYQASVAASASRLQARGPEYARYRELWLERPQKTDPGPFPLHLDIETTNVCNLGCIMCPRTKYLRRGDWRWSPRGLGRMDFPLFARLIDQAAAEGAVSVKLNLLGEPLLHPDVVRQVEYAHRKGLLVMMNTNAALLDPEMSRKLLAAGLEDVFFSLDAAEAQAYETIRPGASFDEVIRNIANFIGLRDASGYDRVRTRLSMVAGVLGPASPEEEAAYLKLARDLGVDETGFGPEDDHLADYSVENRAGPGGFVCEQIYQRLFITWDAALIPCCGHWEREYVIGSALETTLREAWLGPEYRRLRQAHEKGRFLDIGICRRCSVPYLDSRARLETAGPGQGA